MFTPRRTVLLLVGFVLFSSTYVAYAQVLGWLDGLPQLPAKMRVAASGEFQPPPHDVISPTKKKLIEAFGAESPEMNSATYETQLEFRNVDSSILLAAGPIPSNPNSTRVTLKPFSLAIFGRPKPAHLLQPGETIEISTIHSDKGILEFDRVIVTANDMRTAKLVRLELVSDFADAVEDPRRGTVHITNNQRSADPNRFLILRTPGPVFYRDAKAVVGTPAALGPDFWTDAAVEIVDRQNLPRSIGSNTPATAPSKSEDVRVTEVVADIIAGRRAPPPTVTAVGMRIYLEPEPPPGQPKPKKSNNGMNGVRRLDFLEQVLINLWIDNGQSMVGGAAPPASDDPPQNNALALTPPPAAIAAVTGCLGTAGYTARLQSRALLQVETRGPFAYDAEKSLARFDVMPHSDPNLPNDVQVTKVPARGGKSTLFSQVLELELNGLTSAGRPPGTPAIKRLHAWTSTPGRFLTVTSEDEATEGYGQDLTHDQAKNLTVLSGAPLYVVKERNVLSAGAPRHTATLTTEPGPAPTRKSQMTVRGAGKVEMYDAASNANTTTATWQISLIQSKELIGGREQDLYTFTSFNNLPTDGSQFDDTKADYWLKGTVLKLWLESRADAPGAGQMADAKAPAGPLAATGTGSQAQQPSRIQAIGKVTSHSSDYDVDQSDHLNVYFADPKPVAAAQLPPPANPLMGPMGPVSPTAPSPPLVSGTEPPLTRPGTNPMGVAGGALTPEPKEPEKPKPPMKIMAKDIQTWVTRVPAPPAPTKPGDKPPAKAMDPGQPAPAPAVKYQLDKARCEDDVIVHQDPTDPAKPRGVDILGRLLLIDGSPDGSVMTVYGWPTRPGEVHQEDMSLIGPKVILDQVQNAASVEGRGALTMPTNSDLSGSELSQPDVVVIHFRDSMVFRGAQRFAKFEGKVSAKQGGSWVLCHLMHVVFDRPVYFNQTQKKSAAPPKDGMAEEKAKIETVFCYPAPADSADDKSDLLVSYYQEDKDTTGKKIKTQLLVAQEMKMEAEARDTPNGEPYQRVNAEGPGILRIWQAGDKDATGPSGVPVGNKPMTPMQLKGPMPPMQPGAKSADGEEQEMKLTIVKFNVHMTAIDKAKLFQKATFKKAVEVINVPSENPDLVVERNKLPPRAVFVKCSTELIVWSHKEKADVPPVQNMDAFGNAYLRTDEYDGWGETINSLGKRVTLIGSSALPARIMNRFNTGNDQSGKKIIYNRATGDYQVFESFGGRLNGGGGSGPKK